MVDQGCVRLNKNITVLSLAWWPLRVRCVGVPGEKSCWTNPAYVSSSEIKHTHTPFKCKTTMQLNRGLSTQMIISLLPMKTTSLLVFIVNCNSVHISSSSCREWKLENQLSWFYLCIYVTVLAMFVICIWSDTGLSAHVNTYTSLR